MNVGDLVQISVESIMSGKTQDTVEGCGIIIKKHHPYLRLILWDDGLIEEQHVNDLVVISESR